MYLCDFYCEQCWKGWVMDSKHNPTNEKSKNLLEFLCNVQKHFLGDESSPVPEGSKEAKGTYIMKNNNQLLHISSINQSIVV